MKDLHGPVLGLYGGADAGILNRSVDKMRAALKAAGSPAAHEVADRQSIRTRRTPSTPTTAPSYRKDQAEDGWKKALAWFKANGVLLADRWRDDRASRPGRA